MEMRIGLDLRSLQSRQQFQGGGAYVTGLVQQLTKIDGPIDWHLFFQPGATPHEFVNLAETKTQVSIASRLSGGGRFSAIPDQLITPITLFKHRIDVFHLMTINTLTWRVPCKRVVTVYDMLPLVYPRIFMKTGVKYHLFYTFLKNASTIIAISEFTKQEIVRLLDIPPDIIKVIYPGVNEHFTRSHSQGGEEGIKNKHGLAKHYLMYVGDLSSSMDNYRKNVNIIIDALKYVVEHYDNSLQLVLVGKTGEYSDTLKQQAVRLGIEDRVIFTGYVKSSELRSLYNGAFAVVYPSRYEGFGLPVLEAMACGVPVITTNVTSIPEVAGEAALMVSPDDTAALVQQICRLLSDGCLSKQLSKKGIEQASHFSWARAADETIAVYQSLYHPATNKQD